MNQNWIINFFFSRQLFCNLWCFYCLRKFNIKLFIKFYSMAMISVHKLLLFVGRNIIIHHWSSQKVHLNHHQNTTEKSINFFIGSKSNHRRHKLPNIYCTVLSWNCMIYFHFQSSMQDFLGWLNPQKCQPYMFVRAQK